MSTPRAIWIKGGKLIDPLHRVNGPRELLLVEGRVKAVSERSLAKEAQAAQALELDATGRWILPGLIDLHVHLREPGEEGKETILTGARAAVAGGFTAVVAMPNTRPVNDNPLVTHRVLQKAAEANLCRVYPAGSISKGLEGKELSEMGELAHAGCVCFTDDGRPVMNAGLMRRALEYAQLFDLPVMVHEEDLNIVANGAMSAGPRATRLGLLPIHPSAEVAMVARDLVLLEETGGRLHLAHMSCAASVRLVREAKRRGLRVTAEATPHHLVLNDEAVEGYDTHAKMNPPLRQPADVEALREGIADGTIDVIATDHAPHGPGDKRVEFQKAMNGVVGLETAVPLVLELVHQNLLTPDRMVELMSHMPARVFGLPGGHLGPGAPADVTIIDPQVEWTVSVERFESKSRNSPFDGRRVRGRVSRTLVGGHVVFEAGQVRG